MFANICPAVFRMMAQQGSTLRLTAEGVSELAMRNITGTFSSGRIADVAVEDPVNANLLFIGTEFGLSFTVDGGRHRVKLKGGMPIITIRDLEIQARECDLVAASFGWGFFVLDDYAALRGLTPELLSQEGALFAPRPQGASV